MGWMRTGGSLGQVWRGWGVKLLLFFALMVAGWGLGVGDAQAQEDELLPLGIIVQPEPGELEVWIETDQRRYDLGDEVTIRFGLNRDAWRSEEHTSELQSRPHLVCRLLLEK